MWLSRQRRPMTSHTRHARCATVRQAPYVVGFYLVPDFPMMAFAAAIEPLRAANRLPGERSSNGGCFRATASRCGRATASRSQCVRSPRRRPRSTCCWCAPARATRAGRQAVASGCARSRERHGDRRHKPRRLCAGACRVARRSPLRAALGEPRRIRRAVSAHPDHHRHLRDRRQPPHMLGRHAALDMMLQVITERRAARSRTTCRSSSSIRGSAGRTIRSGWPCRAASASPTEAHRGDRHDGVGTRRAAPGAGDRRRGRPVTATTRAPVCPVPACESEPVLS